MAIFSNADAREVARTSESSVTEKKIRRADEGMIDSRSKKFTVNPERFYTGKNLRGLDLNDNDLKALYHKSHFWPMERRNKTWLEGEAGQAAIRAIKEGSYEFGSDPEHDDIWRSKQGMLAIGVDPEVVAFLDGFYRKIIAAPDWDKIKGKFEHLLANINTRQFVTQAFVNQQDISPAEAKKYVWAMRFYRQAGFEEAKNTIKAWFDNGGYKYVACLQYANTLKSITDLAYRCRTIDELKQSFKPDWFITQGMAESHFRLDKHGKSYYPVSPLYQGILNESCINVVKDANRRLDEWVEKLDKESARLAKALKSNPVMKLSDFRRSKALLSEGDIITYVDPNDSKNKFTLNKEQTEALSVCPEGSFVVVDPKSKSVIVGLPNEEIANTWALELYNRKGQIAHDKGQELLYLDVFSLNTVSRTGYLYREGHGQECNVLGKYQERIAIDEDGKKIQVAEYDGELKTMLNVAGITFGNGVTLTERSAFVNAFYDSIRDMGNVMGIDPKTLFGGTMALSVGASGRGGRSAALAHFNIDPKNNYRMVALTRYKGFGSLGHEMMHCFDSYYGEKVLTAAGLPYQMRSGTFLTENFRHATDSWRAQLKESFPAAHDLAEFITSPHTSFYRTSSLMDFDNENPYWSRPCEMFARASAAYLEDKFKEKGWENDILNGNARGYAFNPLAGYVSKSPNAAEQIKFNTLMDNFVNEVKEKQLAVPMNEMDTHSLYYYRTGEEKYVPVVTTETSTVFNALCKKAQGEKLNAKVSEEEIKMATEGMSIGNNVQVASYLKKNLTSQMKAWTIDVTKIKTASAPVRNVVPEQTKQLQTSDEAR